jgi:hypothetical protein
VDVQTVSINKWYLCTNLTSNGISADVVGTLDPSAVTKNGTVLVTPELRVKLSSGAQNVWAIGDIIEWPEQKVWYMLSGKKCTRANLFYTPTDGIQSQHWTRTRCSQEHPR